MSGKYTEAREAFGAGDLSWTRDRIVAQLVSGAYVFAPVHRGAGALTGLIGEPVVLTGKSVKDGWASSARLTFRQVSGPDAVALVLRRDGGEGQSTLIAYLDQIERFPMKLNGGDIAIDAPDKGFFRV